METISYDEFKKVDIRVCTVLEAELVTDSNKLLKLNVDLGEELGKRQIIAGIQKSYVPEVLVGRQILIVANLEPRSLAGLESQGMVFAVSDEEGRAVLYNFDRKVSNGTRAS